MRNAPLWFPAVFLASLACSGGGADDSDADAGTDAAQTLFYDHVAPIFMERCVACHSDDEETRPAPFSLTNYVDAKEWGQTGLISYAVENRIMPPYAGNNDGDCGSLKDALWLTQGEIDTIVSWVDDGMPEGDPSKAPAVPEPKPGLVDPTVTMLTPTYAPTEWVSDDLHCFVLDPQLDQDMYIVEYEIVADTPTVNHHGILFHLPDSQAVADAEDLDAQDPTVGYGCFGDSNVAGAEWVAAWVPGIGAQTFPTGTGIKVNAGSKLVLQMHNNYTQNNMALLGSKVTVKLKLAQAVDEPASIFLVPNATFEIPAGVEYQETSTQISSPGTAKVWGLLPHMHRMGRTLRVDHQDQCMFQAENYDFDWQRNYWFEQPIDITAGDSVKLTCGFDTRLADGPVTWGDRSEDEMCLAIMYVTGP